MGTYLIIGASSGIGKKLFELLKKEGKNVHGTYFSNDHGSDASYHFLDVLNEEIDLSFLPDQLDGLVYCPGTIDLKPFSRIKSIDLRNDIELQVLGAIRVIQAALTKLKASKKGSIVLFSTIATQTGFPFHVQVAVSKGAIEGLTKSLAAELAPTIRVNAIAPSITNTPLAGKLLSNEEKINANGNRHPMKRIGEAEDIAETAAFLLSEKSSWITGQVLHVDGGLSTLRTN
jgi:NAD(P)-dependent dehydrogenase (short-subunit alcohol dehydrogenase family)